jgi:hypothetical protein
MPLKDFLEKEEKEFGNAVLIIPKNETVKGPLEVSTIAFKTFLRQNNKRLLEMVRDNVLPQFNIDEDLTSEMATMEGARIMLRECRNRIEEMIKELE